MGIAKKWSTFNFANIDRIGNVYGVYELGNNKGNTHYIGQGRLWSRLRAHFGSGSDPIPGTAYFRIEFLGSKVRAEQRERALLRDFYHQHGHYPKFNQRYG